MTLLKVMKRGALIVGMGAGLFMACVSIHLRVEQYRFRRRAEELLGDLRGLELRKASAEEVRKVVKKWSFQEWGRGPSSGERCTEDDCDYRLELYRKTDPDVFSNPFAARAATLPMERLGARPTAVHAWVRMRAKQLASVSFSVWTTGRGCEARGRAECTLMGQTETNQRRSGWSSHQQPDVKLKQSLSHPGYLVGAFPELENIDTGGSPTVIVWAEFSPDANLKDISRLMRFDLSCLTRFVSCRERDLMPEVWAQSIDDARQSQNALKCSPEVSRRVADLADTIAVARPTTFDLKPPHHEGQGWQLHDLQIVDVLKKPDSHSPELTKVAVDKLEMTSTADTKTALRAGQEYLFLLQEHNTPLIGWMELYPCGVLSMSDANLAMAKEAALRTEQ
jgi:hypothetical protein